MAAERAWYESEKVWLVHKDGFSLGETSLLPSRRESRLKSSPAGLPPPHSHRQKDGGCLAARGEGEDLAGARRDRPGRGRRRRGEGE